MKWNHTQIMNFIHLYEAHPCLWQTDLPEYKNKKKRKQALLNIVKGMNMPDFTEYDCKTKIKNVRSHYCQELRKVKNSLVRHSNTEKNVYKPSIPWFKALDNFLRPVVVQKTANFEFQNGHSRDLIQEDIYSEDNEYALDECSEAINTDDPKSNNKSELRPICAVDIQSNSSGYSLNPRTGKRKRKSSDSIEKDYDIFKLPTKKTEFEIFGQSVAAQLSTMPLEDALRLQLEIQLLITKKRIKENRKRQARMNKYTNKMSKVLVPSQAVQKHPISSTSGAANHSEDSDDSVVETVP